MSGHAPQAVLTDVGGVLTTSVIDGFRSFSTQVAGDPHLVERLFRHDREATHLLVEHESGRLSAAAFERGFGERLRHHGVDPVPEGLLDRLLATLEVNSAMVAAVSQLKASGVPVAVVSNSLGDDDAYRAFDLDALANVAVISGRVGVRKPSRRIYQIACERLGVNPGACVMIDDLDHNLAGAARLGIKGLLHVDTERTIRTLAAWFGGD